MDRLTERVEALRKQMADYAAEEKNKLDKTRDTGRSGSLVEQPSSMLESSPSASSSLNSWSGMMSGGAAILPEAPLPVMSAASDALAVGAVGSIPSYKDMAFSAASEETPFMGMYAKQISTVSLVDSLLSVEKTPVEPAKRTLTKQPVALSKKQKPGVEAPALPKDSGVESKKEEGTPQQKATTKEGFWSWLSPLMDNKNKFWAKTMTDGKFNREKSGAAWNDKGNMSGFGWAAAAAQIGLGYASGKAQAGDYGAAVSDRTKAAGTLQAASGVVATVGGPYGWAAAAVMQLSAVALQMEASQKAKEYDAKKAEENIEKDRAAQERALRIAEAQRNLLGSMVESMMALRADISNVFKQLPSSAFLSGRYSQAAPIQVANLTVQANNPVELSQALSQALSSQVARGA
ncbi:MAG: hypothetical protein MZW92_31455 [Comamonadaceae bacterium]|nr:hypothetical protein [Comamonadaceae bacterium]